MFNKDLLIFSLMTFITVVVWTVLDVYHTKITSQSQNILPAKIEPLDPKINTDLVYELKTRYDLNSLPQPAVNITIPASNSASATVSGTTSR